MAATLLQSLEEYQRQGDPLNRIEELVEVPNAEFVALIVGRNGHKIKAIREKTGTFIKTPMRNEAPIFKIAGTLQNVAKARTEILETVQRLKSPHYRMGQLGDDSQGPRITVSVRVPFKFVGLVVGFQGSTIMDIQCKTKTHIQTPAHGGDPVFQISGEPKDVWMAKIMIQFYIEYRTGLRVQDVDSLVDGAVEEPILQLLSKHGVSHTLTLLMSRLDNLLANDPATAQLFSPGAFPPSAHFLEPNDTIGIKLDSFKLEEHFQEINGHQIFVGQPPVPTGMQMHSPPPAQQQSAEFPRFVQNQLHANPGPLHATQPINEQLFDATSEINPLDMTIEAITHQPINALFPDSGEQPMLMNQQNENITGNFWMGPMIYPPATEINQQQQGLQNQRIAAENEQRSPSFLDKNFWDYVANADNELLPEQVL